MKRFTPKTPQKAFPESRTLEKPSVSSVPEKEQILSNSRLREVEEKIESIEKEFRKKQISDPEKIILDHFEFLDLFKISRRTSQHWRERARIPYSLIGGRIYFTLADIQKLVEEHRVPIMNSKLRIQNSADEPSNPVNQSPINQLTK